jgi:hypothetical protein
VVSVVREAQQSLRVIDADNIDEMADDILAEEEADDLLEGGWAGGWAGGWGGTGRAGAVCRVSGGARLLRLPDPEE